MTTPTYNETESKELINFYYQNPQHNNIPTNYTIKQTEGNPVCGDDITVFLTIDNKNNTIEDRNFGGNTSMITTAAASFFGDLTINKHIDTVLTWNYSHLQQEGFVVSPRRKRAVVIALLATKNAIHQYKKDGRKEGFEDILNGA